MGRGRYNRYTIRHWHAVRDALAKGGTIRAVASETGVGRSTVFSWSRMDAAPDRMWSRMEAPVPGGPVAEKASPRARLDLARRAVIEVRLRDGRSMREIAREIGVSHTTVAREVRRNACPDGRYRAGRAQRAAESSARRPRPRKVESSPRLRAYVVARLAERWSPRQISARLVSEFPDDGGMRLSHEAIYQALYVQGRGSLRQELRVEQALRSGRRSRRPRSALPPRSGARTWVEGCEISLRPAEAADRAVPGHWEGDLVVGPGRACLVTLVERSTRYLEARRLDARDSRTVVDLLIGMVAEVPDGIRSALCSTLTWDRGSELAQAARFTEATGFRVYFCDPRSPWQKGTNENTNGLLRQYFPKGTDFSAVTDEEVRAAQDQLNGRPRETLGWRTPAEALAEYLAGESGAMTA